MWQMRMPKEVSPFVSYFNLSPCSHACSLCLFVQAYSFMSGLLFWLHFKIISVCMQESEMMFQPESDQMSPAEHKVKESHILCSLSTKYDTVFFKNKNE